MDETLHKTLIRQIKKIFGENFTPNPELSNFIKVISETYKHFDEDRALVEHSMDVSSKELLAINKEIREKAAALELRSVEMEKLNKYMIGRELRMAELKKELQECESRIAALEKCQTADTQQEA